jgi:hypothetical protein
MQALFSNFLIYPPVVTCRYDGRSKNIFPFIFIKYRMEWKYNARIITVFLARLEVLLVVTVNIVTTCSQVEITDVLD